MIWATAGMQWSILGVYRNCRNCYPFPGDREALRGSYWSLVLGMDYKVIVNRIGVDCLIFFVTYSDLENALRVVV